jgi:hypothetical protein
LYPDVFEVTRLAEPFGTGKETGTFKKLKVTVLKTRLRETF